MQITVVTPPPFEPVTLAQAYLHLRLDPIAGVHPDDAMLTRQITTAREQVEQLTRRSLITQRLAIALPGWPCDQFVELKRPPYIGTVTVKYYDTDNVEQTLAGSSYYVNAGSDTVPRLVLTTSSLPATYARDDAITVSWVAGYPATVAVPTTQAEYAGNVPASLVDAVLIGVQMLYDELAVDKRTKLELVRQALVSSYRVYSF